MVFVARWLAESPSEIAQSDFPPQQAAGILWGRGEAARAWDDAVQAPVYAAVVAPDHAGLLKFLHAPPALVLAAPFSGLPLRTAFLLWGLLQVLVLAVAVILAGWAAPWAPRNRGLVIAACLVGLAGPGTLALLERGQDLAGAALGIAGLYVGLRRGRDDLAGAILVCGAMLAKPHLILGLVAWAIGWRNRRLLAGMAAGAVAGGALWLLAAGAAGSLDFVHSTLGVASESGSVLLGFVGLVSAWLGSGGVARLVGLAGSVLLLGGAALIGDRLRRGAVLEYSLAAATALSLLAAPHLLAHDLVLLAPLVPPVLARVAATPGDRGIGVVVAVAALLSVAVDLDTAAQLPAVLGRLTAYALIGVALVAARQAVRSGDTTPPPLAASG